VVPQAGEPPRPYIIEGIVTVVFADGVDLSAYNDGFGKASFALASVDRIMDQFQVDGARALFPWEKEAPPPGSSMPDYTRYYEMSFSADVSVAEVVAALSQNPHVAVAEPVWALPMTATPNDPLFNSQWHMTTLNMNVRAAWDSETGSDSIIIAIIDSGVKYTHGDLKGNIWVNPGEDLDGDGVVYDIDDLNGVDDDGNGIVDDLIGYDFFTGISGCHSSEDCYTPDPDPDDFNGHGTHCAGIAAAMTNNSAQISGMAGGWYSGHRSYRGARIMCLRVGASDSYGNGYVNTNNCGTAIQYAARNGAHIINCSWGSQYTSSMGAGMALVDSAGVTICHAAGNEGIIDPDYLDFDPGGMNVLSVAAVENNDTKWSASNYGYEIDVCAYGTNILSTVPSGTARYWGTSMAAPMVCGLAALVRSAMPSLTKEQVDSVIINTCHDVDDVNPSYEGMLGAGRIDAQAALGGLASARFTSTETDGEVPLTVQFTDQSPYLPTAWDWNFGNGDASTEQSPLYTYTEPGVYDVSLIVDDSVTLGPGEEHLTNYIWARADTIRIESATIDRGGTAMLGVYLANTTSISEIQFTIDTDNDDGITCDSFSVAGLRTEYFDYVQYNVISNGIHGILMKADPPNSTSNWLPADTGAILNLYFSALGSATPGAVVEIDTVNYGNKTPNFETRYGNYVPLVVPGLISVVACSRGDIVCDQEINITDLIFLVTYMFQGGSPPDPFYTADIDGNGVGPDIVDLIYLVTYMFQNGPLPPAL
jgi:subtilisin family serine protease